MRLEVQAFFHEPTFTLTYVVYDESTGDGVIIDPTVDFDSSTDVASFEALERVLSFVSAKNIRVRAFLETHVHADHLSAGRVLQKRFPGVPVCIGANVRLVQQTYENHVEITRLPTRLSTDGCQFDRLLSDGEEFYAGSLPFSVIYTPGHTPACCSYVCGDCVFTGDALFMPDAGTGRCDFPGGSASALYHSVHERLYALPRSTRVFVGHDYQPNGRALAYEATIAQQMAENIHIKLHTTEAEFVAFRTARDAQLAPPRLLYPSLRANLAGGALPCAVCAQSGLCTCPL
jgi:glyoxylase-like metal-dependent hydrolase (beta-lactamase superfamily II)